MSIFSRSIKHTSGGFHLHKKDMSEFENKYLAKLGREIQITILTHKQSKYCRIFYPETEDKIELGSMLMNLGQGLIVEEIEKHQEKENE